MNGLLNEKLIVLGGPIGVGNDALLIFRARQRIQHQGSACPGSLDATGNSRDSRHRGMDNPAQGCGFPIEHVASRQSGIDVSTESWRVFSQAGHVLAFAEVVQHWRGNAEFRIFWNASLREIPFDAYCWECPPITVQSSSRQFEVYLYRARCWPGCRLIPDRSPNTSARTAKSSASKASARTRGSWRHVQEGRALTFPILRASWPPRPKAAKRPVVCDGNGARETEFRQANLAQHRGRRRRLAARQAGYAAEVLPARPLQACRQ